MTANSSPRPTVTAATEVVILLVSMAIVACYALLRYGGLWGETDTSAFASAIRAMLADGQLIPGQHVYPNGYGFQAVATFLVSVTGISVAQLQLMGGALLAIWLVIPAWLAYRELIGSARGATLAAVILFVQPDFLFPIMRGSHEKFTRGLMFLCLYLLVRSILSRQHGRQFAGYLLAFYLAIYMLIALNSLFATSFIAALSLSLALNFVISRFADVHSEHSVATQKRLLYAVGVSFVLSFIFTFYAYAPARHDIQLIKSIWDQLALLFLDIEQTAVNPYSAVATGWINPWVYLLVSSANWVLLALSFAIWSGQTLPWLRQRALPHEAHSILLWSLYTAFGFLGAVSIVVDISGAIAGNLQHRIFPSFAMIAAAFVADWLTRRQALRLHSFQPLYAALALGVALLGVVAIAKATNEPALSNKWIYHMSNEFVALDWGSKSLPDAPTWTEFDERLVTAGNICCAWEDRAVSLDVGPPVANVRNYLLSEVTRARSERLGLPLPIVGDSQRIYDNGEAEIYRLRAQTPFQK